MTITHRKGDHINIYIQKHPVSSWNYWDDVVLVHESVPEFDLGDVELKTMFLGKSLSAPLIISGMTGGYPRAEEINRRLAEAAERTGVGMGVGSQRAALLNPDTVQTYSVVKEYEIPVVMGNLGAPQFSDGTYTLEDVKWCMEMIGADVMAVHLNYLQEIVQPEGDAVASGFWENIKPIASEVPLLLKETGAGISRRTAERARDVGFVGLDVGGLGGTSFSAMEYYRTDKNKDAVKASLGKLLWNWGIPTPVSLFEANIGLPIIATGGIRSGLDAVRALSLGADVVGLAGILLEPALSSVEDVVTVIERIKEEMRRILFLTGVRNPGEAGYIRWFALEPTRSWMEGLGYSSSSRGEKNSRI